MLARVTDQAVQIFGGMGLMDELPLERLWRDARVERIWDGTSEIQRHIISRGDAASARRVSDARACTAAQAERLLGPKSIAVVGGRAAEQVVRQSRLLGFTGTIWAVNPTRELGRRALPSPLEALPGVPDAVFFGVNREATVEAVEVLRDGRGGASPMPRGSPRWRTAAAQRAEGGRGRSGGARAELLGLRQLGRAHRALAR